MNLKRNQKEEATETTRSDSPTGKNKRRTLLIAAAIAAVFVVHFAWQFSFVQKENLRIAEDSLNNARLEIAPDSVAEPLETEETIAAESAAVTNETTNKKAVGRETAKVVVPVKYAPPENKSASVETKKAARETRSARLRRAEKLLTGF